MGSVLDRKEKGWNWKKTQNRIGNLDETAKMAIAVERDRTAKTGNYVQRMQYWFHSWEILGNKFCVVTMGVRLLKWHVDKEYSNLTGIHEGFTASSLCLSKFNHCFNKWFWGCWSE